MLVVFGLLSFVFLKNHFVIRDATRWFLRSRHYKAEVLNQPEPLGIELKHVDWDGGGFPGQVTQRYMWFSIRAIR